MSDEHDSMCPLFRCVHADTEYGWCDQCLKWCECNVIYPVRKNQDKLSREREANAAASRVQQWLRINAEQEGRSHFTLSELMIIDVAGNKLVQRWKDVNGNDALRDR